MSLRGNLLFIERLGELVFGLGHDCERRPEVGVALGEGVAVPSQLLLQLLDPGGHALRVLFGEAVRQQLVLTGDETDLLEHLERTELNYLSSGKYSLLGFATTDKAANLDLATARAVTDLRHYINSNLVFSDLKF